MALYDFKRKRRKVPKKKCRIRNCKKLFHARGYCRNHYMTKVYERRSVNIKRLNYYTRYLNRDTINEKEYVKFRNIWHRLDQKINMERHKQSVVEKIMRKYIK